MWTFAFFVYTVFSRRPVPGSSLIFFHTEMLGDFVVFLGSFQVNRPRPVTQWTGVLGVLPKRSLRPGHFL